MWRSIRTQLHAIFLWLSGDSNAGRMPDSAKLASPPQGVLKKPSHGTAADKEEWISMEKSKDKEAKDKKSRFQVAKVDFAKGSKDDNQHSSSDEDEQPGGGGNYSNSYDTHNMRSLHQYTREALPRLDHYRNVMSVHGHMDRPTLDELHNATLSLLPEKSNVKSPGAVDTTGQLKLGWIQGVLVRVLLNIWGVILFLRLSWVVGQAGIGLTMIIILLATVVTLLTAISMSAICTNGEVKGGGTYYMISRSLGPEFGGSIGVIFSLANAVAIAMYVVGFAESVRDVLAANQVELPEVFLDDNGINLVRLIGMGTCIVLLCIALIGTEWESKAQMVLLVVLLGAMFNFVLGVLLPAPEAKIGKGFLGLSVTLAAENFGPAFQPEGGKEYGFFQVFAVFFPAATGILAGANISGDLADPSVAIPKGTVLGIIVTSISYMIFGFLVGASNLRYATGISPPNATDLSVTELMDIVGRRGPCSVEECPNGLFNDVNIMEMVSIFGPLVNAGIFAATLSSALASLVSAPKVFQALCKDKLFPHIDVFGKGFGPNNEPRRGYYLAMAIGICCVAIGKLNLIAPLISNFFMAAYCLINFACFHASFARSPGFRPSFKYYNMWTSFVGSVLCLGVMFVMEPYTALITFAVILGLHIYIGKRKPDVNWGSSTQAQTYKDALNAVYKLNQVEDHVKNYRPQILVLSGEPNHRPPLIDFAYSITKKLSLLMCGHVVRPPLSYRARHNLTLRAQQWLQRRKVKSFYSIVVEEDKPRGIRSLLQCSGVGKLKPNVVMLGYKYQWMTCNDDELEEYFNIIHEIFDHHMSIAILRLPEGLDYSEYANTDALMSPTVNGTKDQLKLPGMDRNESTLFPRNVSAAQLSTGGSSREGTPPATPQPERKTTPGNDSRENEEEEALVAGETAKECPKEVLINVNQFLRKQRKGTIDVWWLYDDGGLTMLVPYLLSTRSNWSACKLRVFSLANKKEELDREQRNMATLLSKFRMEYSDVLVIPDVQKPPSEESKREFDKLIARWRTDQDEAPEDNRLAITDSELLALKAKTYRHLRLREFLEKHSRDANLIVMTLPMPRKNTCSASLYMAWLEMLTKDMPPFLFIRGNQTSVLTFYS